MITSLLIQFLILKNHAFVRLDMIMIMMHAVTYKRENLIK